MVSGQRNPRRVYSSQAKNNNNPVQDFISDTELPLSTSFRFYFIRLPVLGSLHMSPVDRAGSVTEVKLVSVHMVTFSSLSEMKNFEKVVTPPFRREI